MPRSNLKSGAGSLLLLVVAVLVSLLLAEGLLRVAGVSFPVFDTYDELRGVALRPGKEGLYQKEGRAYLRINSYGYRDSEHELTKPPGTFRVAVLGDSFAEARQVEQEDTFWSLLGPGLEACDLTEATRVEVLNFGVGGYGTTEELLTWRQDAVRFSPDLVILAFFPGNDVRDNSKALRAQESWRIPAPVYVLSEGKLVLETPPASRWRKLLCDAVHHSRVLELVNEVRRRRAARDVGGEASETRAAPGVYGPPLSAEWKQAWLVTEALLDCLSQEVISTGARFAVMIIPTPNQVHPDPGIREALTECLGVEDLLYANRRIAEIGLTHGFATISLAEPLRRIAEDRGVYFYGFENALMGEGHWNEAGHSQVARILAEEVCGKVLAPRPALQCLR